MWNGRLFLWINAKFWVGFHTHANIKTTNIMLNRQSIYLPSRGSGIWYKVGLTSGAAQEARLLKNETNNCKWPISFQNDSGTGQ